jgi:hypothetical protein
MHRYMTQCQIPSWKKNNMKTSLLFSCFGLAIFCCKPSAGKHGPDPVFQHVLGTNNNSSASLSVTKDSVFIVYTAPGRKNPRYYLQTWYFRPNTDNAIAGTKEIPETEINTQASRMKKMPVSISTLSKTGIIYETLPANVLASLSKQKAVTKETRFHKYDGKYYFTNTYHSGSLYVYDPATDSIETFKYDDNFLEIRDFFLYDITGDKQPEVIIFSEGNVPRENVTSIDIYMINRNEVADKNRG